MSQQQPSRPSYLGLKLIIAVVLATALVFIWSSSRHQQSDRARDTWVDASGSLHVLDVTLGKSTLREAEVALKSRADIALYIYPQEHPEAGLRLEAYFPSIADHSKVILKLAADELTLKQIEQRATMPHLYPNKVARMNLHPEDLPRVQQLIVAELVLIPSIEVTADLLKARFGESSTVSSDSEGIEYHRYPDIGLTARLKKGDAARLSFVNPQ